MFVLRVSLAGGTEIRIMADSALVPHTSDAALTGWFLAEGSIAENTGMDLGVSWRVAEGTVDRCKAMARMLGIGGFDASPAKVPVGAS
jgi:hypothetical protein